MVEKTKAEQFDEAADSFSTLVWGAYDVFAEACKELGYDVDKDPDGVLGKVSNLLQNAIDHGDELADILTK